MIKNMIAMDTKNYVVTVAYNEGMIYLRPLISGRISYNTIDTVGEFYGDFDIPNTVKIRLPDKLEISPEDIVSLIDEAYK